MEKEVKVDQFGPKPHEKGIHKRNPKKTRKSEFVAWMNVTRRRWHARASSTSAAYLPNEHTVPVPYQCIHMGKGTPVHRTNKYTFQSLPFNLSFWIRYFHFYAYPVSRYHLHRMLHACAKTTRQTSPNLSINTGDSLLDYYTNFT